MSRRLIIILTILALVVLLGAAAFFFLPQRPPAASPQGAPPAGAPISKGEDSAKDNSGAASSPAAPEALPSSIDSAVDSETAVKSAAITFVERYGSYSSDADFANWKSLDYLATDALKAQLAAIIEQGFLSTAAPPPFYAVSSRVVVTTVNSLTSSQAELTLTTQRQEVFNRAAAPTLRYQDIKVDLRKVNDHWLIDAAEWVKE